MPFLSVKCRTWLVALIGYANIGTPWLPVKWLNVIDSV